MIALVVIALVGLTLLVTGSAILAPVRRLWPKPLSCAQCVGTWVGAAAGATGVLPFGYGRLPDAILAGAALSYIALFAHAVLIYFLGEPAP